MNIERKSPQDQLLPYQKRWVEDESRFKIGLWARQTGKDFACAEEGIRDCYLREKDGKKTDWLIAAPSERQSLESLEKWKEWAETYKLAIVDLVEERANPRDSRSMILSTTIKFRHGSRVIAVPGRPDTVRGFSAHVVATEFAFFDDPDRTWRALVPSITNPLRNGPKKVRLISTPNGCGNKFHDLWVKNYKGTEVQPRMSPDGQGCGDAGTGEGNLTEDRKGNEGGGEADGAERRPYLRRWACHRVTIMDAVAEGLEIDVEELRESLDDPEGWAQEYDPLEFMDTASVLLPYELIAACENANAMEVVEQGFWFGAQGGEPIFCGIDFGRRRDLTVCWSVQLLGGAFKLTKEVLCLDGMPTPEQIEILRPRMQRARRVCMDYTGAGIGLGDFLAREFGEYCPERHQFGKIELCTFTGALKQELFPKLRMELERKLVGLPVSREVREDLHSVSRVVSPDGSVTYRAAHTADGHADRCTALALAVRASATAATGAITAETLPMIRTGPNVSPRGFPHHNPMRLVRNTAGLPRFTENGIPIIGR